MDYSNLSKFLKFGKLENNDDSDSEDSLFDSSNEDSVSEKRGNGNSSKTDENQQRFTKEMKKHTSTLNSNSPFLSCLGSYDAYKGKNYDGNGNSSKTDVNQQRLTKEMEKLTSTVNLSSPFLSCLGSYDAYTGKNYDGSETDGLQPPPRYGANAEKRNLFGKGQRLEERSLTSDDGIQLPSEVTDKEYIYMPPASEQIDDEEDMNTSGKWMLFPYGDLQKLAQYWLALIPLYKTGALTRLKCSTAMGSNAGVINCYTADSGNLANIKFAADAIRECINYDTIMYYKTNEATARGLYNQFGSKNISKYMHTVNNSLYEKKNFKDGSWCVCELVHYLLFDLKN